MTKYLTYQFLVLKRRIAFNYRKWLFAFIGSFAGISLVIAFHQWIGELTHFETVMLIGSFGASAVIIFGTPQSPYALPRHAIGGHVVSALIGVTIFKCIGVNNQLWISCGLAVALSIFMMQLTRTIHPPGGATALIAVIGTPKVHSLGYLFILTPVLTGILILLGISAIMQFVVNKTKHKSSDI